MQYFLFVHFRETTTPDGEQVYFALSQDGFHWEALHDGRPILWAYQGDHGVRDMTIVRDQHTGQFHIFATDLSLSYGMRGKYQHSWEMIRKHGSHALAHWVSDDLLHWSEENLIELGDHHFGCLWAPDVFYDKTQDDYILHWSSSHQDNDYGPMGIYYARTRDFEHYTAPQLLYRKDDGAVIDSAMYAENDMVYLFVKSEKNPEHILLLRSASPTGPFTRIAAFDDSMRVLQSGKYEAPTACRLQDGRWCLFLDYYGVKGAGQGYVPFLAESLESGVFTRSDASFSFPYGFKHGTILSISQEEYASMKAHDWDQVPDLR